MKTIFYLLSFTLIFSCSSEIKVTPPATIKTKGEYVQLLNSKGDRGEYEKASLTLDEMKINYPDCKESIILRAKLYIKTTQIDHVLGIKKIK
ncbi:MAG: hypothetical protein ACI8Q1_002594 [Parvicella sp.]|jgi:hypothetical protein